MKARMNDSIIRLSDETIVGEAILLRELDSIERYGMYEMTIGDFSYDEGVTILREIFDRNWVDRNTDEVTLIGQEALAKYRKAKGINDSIWNTKPIRESSYQLPKTLK